MHQSKRKRKEAHTQREAPAEEETIAENQETEVGDAEQVEEAHPLQRNVKDVDRNNTLPNIVGGESGVTTVNKEDTHIRSAIRESIKRNYESS